MNSTHLLRSAVMACAICGGASLIAYSQVAEQVQVKVPGGINPESMYGKESAQGVYVRDSAVALEKFAQAQRMERLKEWSKAADLYQEVLEKFADRVVPSQVDKDNNIYQYTSVIAAVQQKMSKWPAEGLEVYRSRYEPSAQALLDGARPDDRAALQGILSRYFATETAKIAGLRLMDLYFESGEFSASAWLADLMLTQHPNLIVERPRVLYRRALALHMAGEEDKSKAVLNELQNKYANDTATIRGVDQKLVESLTAELSQPAPRATAVADSAWPMYGGSPNHARLSTAAGRPGAKLYSIELAKPNYKGMQGEQASQLKQRDRLDQDSGGTLTVMPVIDHGEMYFQDGQRIYALSIESGQPLPAWSNTYPGDRRGQYTVGKGRTLPRGQLQTITLTDSRVLAVMGQGDRFAQMFGAEGATGDVKLVCLDRATGAEKWVAQPRTLPDEAQALRNAEFGGSPLIVDQNVYVVARGSKGQQFEDCSVICYDLTTGKYKWHCYVASANSVANAMIMDGDGMAAPSDAIPQLAYAGGRLYVLTNLGALASIDAYGGRIVWLSIYQRDEATNRGAVNPFFARMNNMNNGAPAAKPWMSNPVFVDNGKIFILPSDGKYLQIYDAGTGVEVKRLDPGHLAPYRNKGEQPSEADSLIAINGSRLLTTGPTSVMYLDWEKYNIETFKKNDQSIVWAKNMGDSIRGRAFVANDRMFISTLTRLSAIALKRGKTEEEYPTYAKTPKGWQPDDPEGPGNIIVSDDHVIIAANRRIDVYTNMDSARQKLDAELAKNPTSPEPRIRYAEVMFVSGDTDTAMTKLDEAIDLLGGRDKMAAGASRDRVYNTALNVAQKLGRDVKDSSSDNLALVQQLYDRVGAAANSPIQQVNYRVLRSKLATTIKDYPTAVKLCQEIIADDDWRKVPVADETSGAQTPANGFAKRSIDQLIRTAGPICYAAYEQEANQQFETAKNAHQADALTRVATIYPNAKVAPQALLVAADLKDSAADHRGAVQLLRQLYLTYPTAPDKRRVLESLARNYMGIPNRTSVAIARLNEAVALGDAPLSQPMPLPGGKVLESGSLAQALAELKKARGQEISKSLPDFKLPVPHFTIVDGKRKLRPPFVAETGDSVIASVQSLLVPPRDYQRYDRIATFTPDKGVSIYAVGSNQPLTTMNVGDAPNLMWSPTGPMLWRAGTLSQFTGDTNHAAWTFDLKAAPAADAVAAAVGGDEVNTDVKSGDDNNGADGDVIVNGNAQVRIIRQGNRRLIVQNGMVREINAPRPGKPIVVPGGGEGIVEVKLAGDCVLLTTTSGRLVALDANDGRIRWQARPGERPADRIVANEDFVAVLLREDNLVTLIVLDTFSGQTIGRRTFDDGFRVPSNIALSPDGTLVYLLPDRVVMKNLYQPWGNAEKEIVDAKAAQTGQFPYVMSQQPDHLQIIDGKLLVMADQNVNLRAFSLETAKPQRYTPVDSKKEIDLTFQTGNRQPNVPVSVRVVGSQVYLIGQQSLIAYNIDHPDQSWRIPTLMQKPNSGTRDEMADVFIGRNHLVLLADTKTKINAGKVAAYRLYAYARYGQDENDPAESGVTTYVHLQGDPSGITAWQPVDGGFYYLAADQKLHFLKGAAN